MSSLNPDGRFEPLRADIDAVVSERMGDTSRRRFLQIMGASMALATASGCTWETEEIVPFQRRPEGRVPGKSRRFATTLECAGVASSLLVTSYDGRPIKIEGNPEHPLDAGACSARTQAALLDLYDPDHSSGLVQVDERVAYPRTWKEFDPYWAGEMTRRRANGGAGLAFLVEPSSSLTFERLRRRLLETFPRARWVEWEPVARTQVMAGAALAFGRVVRTQPRIRAARTLVCLDSDLLGDHPAALANARAFAARREPGTADMLRMWVVESTPTVTGAAADHRLALRAEQVLPFVLALEQRVQNALGGALDPASRTTVPAGGFLASARVERFLASLASELAERLGDTLITVGPRQPAVVHALVHRLNAALGNVGRALVYTEDPDAGRPDPAAAITSLVRAMESDAVDCLVILGGNPVYDAPADVDFFRALRRVPLSLHLSHSRDETSRACTWHLPRAHTLESWGDACSWDGTRCTTQPLIDPIHERRTPIEFVAVSIGTKENVRDLVRASVAAGATEAQWKRILHDGFVKDSQFAPVEPAIARFDVPAIEPRQMQPDLANGQLEIVFAADARVFDGRSANNSWLQEVPDSITKMTWGNAAFFAPATAAALGVADASIVKLRLGARELEVAAIVVPGQAPGSMTLHLGYGRTAAGLVGGLIEDGVAPIGFDAYRLRSSNALDIVAGLSVEPTTRAYPLARTTDPEVTDEVGLRGREERLAELVRETSLKRLREGGASQEHEAHAGERTSLWAAPHADTEGARWGMSIDLNACIGCNACTIACQAENNIPVVGREQVIRGREMHWIRIDRYISGPNDSPKVRFLPMACQHCENAPCEQVCPVAATMHSAEGLNDMVYNRCIGTRYCANNCPFKVRRFNYFNYHEQVEKDGAEVQRMIYNPEVTIRHRGVMEKCTFCVQRIQSAKIEAKNAGRAVADGDITPACAQTCPTTAIVFGDLADPESRVARLHAEERSYTMLDELNIHPRTTYMTKVTNHHPDVDEHDG